MQQQCSTNAYTVQGATAGIAAGISRRQLNCEEGSYGSRGAWGAPCACRSNVRQMHVLCRELLPGLLQALVEGKPQVRQAAGEALAGLEGAIPPMTLVTGLLNMLQSPADALAHPPALSLIAQASRCLFLETILWREHQQDSWVAQKALCEESVVAVWRESGCWRCPCLGWSLRLP